jgi:4-hydroxythreonine-4-phosphate dehydrogenase
MADPLPIALTMGEPAGIGGEIALKTWLAHPPKAGTFFMIADPATLNNEAAALGLNVPIQPITTPAEAIDVFPQALPVLAEPLAVSVTPGQPNIANAPAVIKAISRGVDLARTGQVAALVTNPIHKKILADSGFPHPGHTEYLGALTDTAHPVMMLACPGLKVVPVTVHMALRDAIKALTTEQIVLAGVITAQALINDFAIPTPRLAVAALNPHAGDGGLLGAEEARIIAPAVEQLKAQGLNVFGPVPADSLFHERARTTYDAVLCMYHDQALIPLKTLDFDRGVDVTLGLPVVRTSPDHGTAFEIAGHGVARESSLIAALIQASEIATNRANAGARFTRAH